jgi:hypothetical protein
MIMLRQVPNVVRSKDESKLYIVTGGISRQLQYTAFIHLCFSQHWAPVAA